MAHFAQINSDDIVIEIVVVDNQDIIQDGVECEQKGIDLCRKLFGSETNWVQCSYNNNFRKQYAGVGFRYNRERDVFIRPQPFPSWTLGQDSDWAPPTPYPEGGPYKWIEETQQWEPVLENEET